MDTSERYVKQLDEKATFTTGGRRSKHVIRDTYLTSGRGESANIVIPNCRKRFASAS